MKQEWFRNNVHVAFWSQWYFTVEFGSEWNHVSFVTSVTVGLPDLSWSEKIPIAPFYHWIPETRSLYKNRVPHGTGLLWPPSYTFYSRSCESSYKFWLPHVGWLFSGWTVSIWRHGNWTRGARFLIRENPNCTILPLDSRNQESAQIPGFWNPMVKWCNWDVQIPGFWNPMVKWCNWDFLWSKIEPHTGLGFCDHRVILFTPGHAHQLASSGSLISRL